MFPASKSLKNLRTKHRHLKIPNKAPNHSCHFWPLPLEIRALPSLHFVKCVFNLLKLHENMAQCEWAPGPGGFLKALLQRWLFPSGSVRWIGPHLASTLFRVWVREGKQSPQILCSRCWPCAASTYPGICCRIWLCPAPGARPVLPQDSVPSSSVHNTSGRQKCFCIALPDPRPRDPHNPTSHTAPTAAWVPFILTSLLGWQVGSWVPKVIIQQNKPSILPFLPTSSLFKELIHWISVCPQPNIAVQL